MITNLIPHQRFQLRFNSDEDIPLPPHKGSSFRGLFGHALKRYVCPDQRVTCEACLLAEGCLYLAIFETPASGERFSNGPNRDPHPFILLPPLDRNHVLPSKKPFFVEITLLGPAIQTIPHLTYAFKEMGKIGLGRNRISFRLTDVDVAEQSNWIPLYRVENDRLVRAKPTQKISSSTPPTPPTSQNFTSKKMVLRTLTPMRFNYKGNLVIEFSFVAFLRSLIFRLDDLARIYGSGPLPIEIPELIKKAKDIKISGLEMTWIDFIRYSNRQKGARKLGGLEGDVTLEGDLTPFLPWLQLGEIMHVGKATSFGLGKYKLSQIGNSKIF